MASERGPKCGAVKTGGVTLRCELDKDHAEDGSWHKAVYTETREMYYDGAHHEVRMTETVTWEPVDLFAEFARKLAERRPAERRAEAHAAPAISETEVSGG